MLRNILNAHPDIFIAPESNFVLHLKRKYARKKHIDPSDFIADLLTEPYISSWPIDQNELKKRLEECVKHNFHHFCSEVLEHLAPTEPKLLGNKNPTNLIFTKQLVRLFPQAKFIHLVRDPRAQVNSMLNVNFERKNITSLSIRWRKYNELGILFSKRYPDRFITIRHEDVVTDPMQTVAAICRFLQVEFKPEMISLREKMAVGPSAHHTSLAEELSSVKLNEWKQSLTPNQIAVCEKYTRNVAKELGYVIEAKKMRTPVDLYGNLLGRSYVLLVRVIYSLPLSWRNTLYRKFITKNFQYWEELAKSQKQD